MDILMVGGTRFVGRHIAQAAVAHGHRLTLLHRGGAPADPYPESEHLHVDRDGDLSVLSDRSFDAVVDVSAYLPGQVHALADVLNGRAGRYLLVSTVSVYDLPAAEPFDEDAPLLVSPEDPAAAAPGQAWVYGSQAADLVALGARSAELRYENYGPLKVLCERAAAERFGDRLTIIRPTFVIGPHDYTYRFTYWVQRIADGGEVLVPGPAEAWLQLIDARDQGAFAGRPLEQDTDGTFHTVWPDVDRASFGHVMQDVADAVAPSGTVLTVVDRTFLRAHGVDGTMLPLWDDEGAESGAPARPDRAVGAGLEPRSIGQSAREVLEAERTEPTARPEGMLSREREAELLAAWHVHEA